MLILEEEMNQIGNALEERIENHVNELKEFEDEKAAISKDCETHNCDAEHADFQIGASLADDGNDDDVYK